MLTARDTGRVRPGSALTVLQGSNYKVLRMDELLEQIRRAAQVGEGLFLEPRVRGRETHLLRGKLLDLLAPRH